MKVVRALQCGEAGMFLTPLIALTIDGPRCIRIGKDNICEVTGETCKAEPVVIIREADHAAVQAALAGAEKALKPFAKELDKCTEDTKKELLAGKIPHLLGEMFLWFAEAHKALTKIAAVKDNTRTDSDVSETP